MLNSIEQSIFKVIIDVYASNIYNSLDYDDEFLGIKLDDVHFPDVLVDSFFRKTKDFYPYMLYISTLYSFASEKLNNMKLMNYIEFYKNDINNIDDLDMGFKRLCLYNTISYILHKRNKNLKLIAFDELINEKTDIFSTINNLYITNNIKEFTKNLIFKFIEYYDRPDNLIKLIKDIITTDEHDKVLKELSDGFINTDDEVKRYKNYLIRLILSSAYLVEINAINFANDALSKNMSNDFANLVKSSAMTPILFYLKSSVKNNLFVLPNDNNLCDEILKRFIVCIFDENEEEKSLKVLDEEKAKELAKINPFYKMR